MKHRILAPALAIALATGISLPAAATAAVTPEQSDIMPIHAEISDIVPISEDVNEDIMPVEEDDVLDVAVPTSATEASAYLANLGVMEMDADLDERVTRAEFLATLIATFGTFDFEPNITTETATPFADADEIDEAYAEAIAIAHQFGITNGNDKNCFMPNVEINRQDMFVLSRRAMDVYNILPFATMMYVTFTDADQLADYAQGAVQTFVNQDILPRTGGELKPLDTISRGDMAVWIYDILDTANLLRVN